MSAATFACVALLYPGIGIAQRSALPEACCGNGPPDIKSNGLGIQITRLSPPLAPISYEFLNEVIGKKEAPRNFWVFVTSDDVTAVYTDADTGSPGTLVQWPYSVKDIDGVAYRVQSGFRLILTWPDGDVPLFFTRPFGKGE